MLTLTIYTDQRPLMFRFVLLSVHIIVCELMLSQAYMVLADQKQTLNIAVVCVYLQHTCVTGSFTPLFNAFFSPGPFYFSFHCHCCCPGFGHPDLAGCAWLLRAERQEAAAAKASAHFCQWYTPIPFRGHGETCLQ